MAQPDKREKKFIVEEASDGETQPTYGNNVSISVADEAGDVIAVTLAVQDQNEDLEEITPLEWWITTTATGAAGTVTAVDSRSTTTGTEMK